MSYTAQEIAERLGGQLAGQSDLLLSDVAPLDEAESHELSYCESRKQIAAVAKSKAGSLLVTSDVAGALKGTSAVLILVDDPQRAFIQAMLIFRPLRPRSTLGISKHSHIHESASIGSDCNVYPGALIGQDVHIGDRCHIGPGAVIGDGTRIGNDCTIHAQVVLYPDVQIGNRVILHANAVIGADGFGYRFVAGALQKIPHTGIVVIEDDVEIGACATVDRAMIKATVIGQGTKLDNQVMIAHNCRIGRHNAFASQVGLAGSVTTGDYVQMGGQVGIADHIRIGSQVRLGGKAGVMNDLIEPGVYHDIPARPEKEAIKTYLNVLKVPELREQIKELTAQIADLRKQVAQLSAAGRQKSAA